MNKNSGWRLHKKEKSQYQVTIWGTVWWCSRSSHFTVKQGDLWNVSTPGKKGSLWLFLSWWQLGNISSALTDTISVFQWSLAPCCSYLTKQYTCMLKTVTELWWSNYNLLHGCCTLLSFCTYVSMCSWVVSGISNQLWLNNLCAAVCDHVSHQDCLSRVIAQVFCRAIFDHWRNCCTHISHIGFCGSPASKLASQPTGMECHADNKRG